MTYYAARLSFIKKYLMLFTQEATKEPPIILAERAIIGAPDHVTAPRTIRQKRHVRGVIDFYIGNVLTESGRLIAFKIGKRHLRPRGTHSKKTFSEIEEEHFPASTVLWSGETQTIFIEKPKKDQMSVKSIINNLTSYLNARLAEYGYVVLIAQLPYKSAFWEIVDKYDTKYSVEFTLFAPNLFDVDSSAKELVDSNKKNYNANKTSFKVENDEGNLVIPKNSKLINDILAYINAGAGKWVTIVGIGGERNTISSESDSKTIDKDLSKYDAETAKEFTSKAVDTINKEDADGTNNE
jgi:hypothetical protein